MSEQNIEALIVRSLEQREEPAIPADFATRVRLAIPAKPARKRRASVGKAVGIAMAFIAAIVAFALAAHTSASFTSLAFDIECVLMLQTLLIVYWLGTRQDIR